MQIYRLDNPLGLIFLIFPAAAVAALIFSRFILKKGVSFSGVSGFEKGFSMAIAGYYATLVLILAGLFTIAFSLSEPQSGIKREKITSEGIDIMVALDVSGSMKTRDFLEYRRIEAAKRILMNFVDKRKGDRIGIVTFSGYSMIRSPATVNFPVLKKIIGHIDVDSDPNSGTAIGIGLASAVNRLLQIDEDVNPESQVIILVTDGINNSGEISPESATEIARQKKIKVHTVGIGKSREVDISLLQYIADETGGIFFHARNSGELPRIFEDIDRMEKREIETTEFTRYKNRGYHFALTGILLLLSGLLLQTLFFKRLG
jgi:Ca-activated chloride channel family protein